MFSGPEQPDFFCSTPSPSARVRPRRPVPRRELLAGDATSATTTAPPTGRGSRTTRPRPAPADMTQTTTSDGDTVDFVIRWERGTINRFIYSIAVLDPTASGPARSRTGTASSSTTSAAASRSATTRARTTRASPDTRTGSARATRSPGRPGRRRTRTTTCVLGGETALMVKARFVTQYGDREYTVGLGGSGGGIQQYVYGQNQPGLLDGAIPQYSYPDMVTQTIHIGDCELLERWMDLKVQEQGRARSGGSWANRSWLEGLARRTASIDEPATGTLTPWLAAPGSTECINGWRGLSPLALNPHGRHARRDHKLEPQGVAASSGRTGTTSCNVYGRDPRRLRPLDVGQRRRPVRTAGVARRLPHPGRVPRAQRQGRRVEAARGQGPGGLPVHPAGRQRPADIDVWSERNMSLSARRRHDARAADRRRASRPCARPTSPGMVFDGKIDIPIIDWRHYLEERAGHAQRRGSPSPRERGCSTQATTHPTR